jgi:hypothetical protein
MKGPLFFAGLTFPQSSLNSYLRKTGFKRRDGQNEKGMDCRWIAVVCAGLSGRQHTAGGGENEGYEPKRK